MSKWVAWIHNEHRVWAEQNNPDSKVHEAYKGPTWGRQDPGGPHVGPMNPAITVSTINIWAYFMVYTLYSPEVSVPSYAGNTAQFQILQKPNKTWQVYNEARIQLGYCYI